MLCPKCVDTELDQIYLHEVPIEQCPRCNGVWLDAGELELIGEHERAEIGWFSKLLKQWKSKRTGSAE